MEFHAGRQKETERVTPPDLEILQTFVGQRQDMITEKPIERDHSFSMCLLKNGKKGSSLRSQHALC